MTAPNRIFLDPEMAPISYNIGRPVVRKTINRNQLNSEKAEST